MKMVFCVEQSFLGNRPKMNSNAPGPSEPLFLVSQGRRGRTRLEEEEDISEESSEGEEEKSV
jgi:hypothetical protein